MRYSTGSGSAALAETGLVGANVRIHRADVHGVLRDDDAGQQKHEKEWGRAHGAIVSQGGLPGNRAPMWA